MRPPRRWGHQHLAIHQLPPLAGRGGVSRGVELLFRPPTVGRSLRRHGHNLLGGRREGQAITSEDTSFPSAPQHHILALLTTRSQLPPCEHASASLYSP